MTLVGVCILIFPPFVASVYVPGFIRIPLLFFILICLLILSIPKKIFLNRYLYVLLFFVFLEVYWALNGNILAGDPVYFLCFCVLATTLLVSFRKIAGFKDYLNCFFLILVILSSLQSFFAFLTYNFNLVSYSFVPIGEKAYYSNYFNPLFGYLSVRAMEFGKIGRSCAYFFEPSYLGWFLTANFFLINRYYKGNKIGVLKSIIFLGALATCSTAVYLVFSIIFILKVYYWLFSWIKIKGKLANIFLLIGIFSLVTIMFTIPKEQLFAALGTSSADDRDERIGTSLLILANTGPIDLLFGKSPGYIEKNSVKGESNQIIKMVVENGIIATIIVLFFIGYCTYKNKFFMITTFLFLNSVVILFTPIFLINLIICKINEENK